MAKRKLSIKKLCILIIGFILVLSLFNKVSSIVFKDSFILKKSHKQIILNENEDKRYRVFIDTGHGGNDAGTVSIDKLYEKNIAFEISIEVINKLSNYSNVDIITSRLEDRYIKLEDRVKHANEVNADYFISIHLNADPNSSKTQGIETYYSESNKKEIEGSYEFADYIQQNIIDSTIANDRGVKAGNLMVTKFTKMPAALVECGFLSNESERNKLTTKMYQEKLAEGIVNGLVNYIEAK